MQESLSSSKAVVRSAFFNLLGFGISVLYMLFLVPLVVGYLGIEQYGLWTLILALTGYVGLVDLGIGTSFVPYIARYATLGSYENVNKVIQHGLLFYVCLSLFVLGMGYVLSPWLFSLVKIPAVYLPSARLLFLIALIGFGFSTVAGVFGSVLSALQRMDTYNILLSAFLIEKFVAIVVALWLGYGLSGMMVADLGVTVLGLVPLIIMTKRYFPHLTVRWMGYDSAMMKTLLKFGTQLQISRIAETIQSHFDKLVLSRFIGLSAVSMYDFGSRPGGRLRALPLTAVSSLIPAVSALDATDNKARIQAALVRSTRYLAIVAVPLFAFFICFAGDIVYIWLGEGYEQAAMTLRVLSFAHIVSVVASAMAFVSQGMAAPEVQMRTTLIQATLNVILSLVLVTMFGFYGAVLGTTISVIVGGLLLFAWYGRRLVERPLTMFVKVIVKPLMSIIPSILVGVGLVNIAEHVLGMETRTERGVLLLCVVLIFVALYGVMIVWSKTISSDDRGFVEGVVPARFKYLLKFF
jgi:O-antigen/teichoic acid export membrane protein